MHRITRHAVGTILGSALLLLAGCDTAGRDGQQGATAGAQTAQQQATADQAQAGNPAMDDRQRQNEQPDMRLEVNVGARELYVYRNGQRVATHPVAVGTSEWPTQTGEWSVGQVVWNPEWIPPKEEWAEDSERKASGDPDNPLGHAQLVYDLPRTIHGTNEPSSVGKAVSHGSIRVTNDVAVQLARLAMEAGGAGRDEAWYRQAQENRSEKRVVDLPRPIPIRVYNGG